MAIKRLRGRALQALRHRLYQDDPRCVRCLAKDPPVVRLGEESDHKIALTNGGEDTPENRQWLCRCCHREKTAEDMGYKLRPVIGLDGYPVPAGQDGGFFVKSTDPARKDAPKQGKGAPKMGATAPKRGRGEDSS
jgi:5-methylcytosine-specific restriction protein A